MKYSPNQTIWAGNLRHEQVGRDFLRQHWLTPEEVKFVRNPDEDLLEIVAKREISIPRVWQ